MDEELKAHLEAQDKKLEAIYASVEKTPKYFLWTLIATVVAFVLPLVGIVLVLPWFITTLPSINSL